MMNIERTKQLKRVRTLIFKALKDTDLHKSDILTIIALKEQKREPKQLRNDVTRGLIRLKKEGKIFNISYAKYTRKFQKEPVKAIKKKYSPPLSMKKWAYMLSPT